jgi:hypothetical protein
MVHHLREQRIEPSRVKGLAPPQKLSIARSGRNAADTDHNLGQPQSCASQCQPRATLVETIAQIENHAALSAQLATRAHLETNRMAI